MGDWEVLPDANAEQKSDVQEKSGLLNVVGTVKAKTPGLKRTKAEESNFTYTVEFVAPKDPAQWASLSLMVFGERNEEKAAGMILFENGAYHIGFYPDCMDKLGFALTPEKRYVLKMEVLGGEALLKLWESGAEEPKDAQGMATLPFKVFNNVGLRTYVHPGNVVKTDLTEGNVQERPVVEIAEGRSLMKANVQNGHIRSLVLNGEKVDMFSGPLGGPSLGMSFTQGSGKANVVPALTRVGDSGETFVGQAEGVDVSLNYALEGDALVIKATAKNTTDKDFSPASFYLNLGLDTCMVSYPSWNDKHFPTFLRTEKTHFWGYAMSPNGSIVGIMSPDPIPSWKLRYNNGGHRINGIQLELLTTEKVPDRSSQTQIGLKPGESRTWTVYLSQVPSLNDVPKIAAKQTGAAFVTADRYTAEPGEEVELSIWGETPESLTFISPVGFETPLAVKDGKAQLTMPEDFGIAKVIAKTKDGKLSEAMLTVRRPWSWYMEQARRWTVKAKQKAGSHVEEWLGFFPSFAIREVIPNPALDAQIDADFDELMPLMYEYDKGMKPTPPSYPNRTQNHAGAASVFAKKYRVSGDEKDLERAAQLADYVIKTQTEDGAYRSHGTHYTSVIYVAKFIMEVMDEEAKLAENDPVWKERYDRHYASVERAMDELALNLDNIQTEGEMTFEDGMISCSYTQLAAWARHYAKPENRQKYVDAAEALAKKHRCLSQIVQPDSRMNNASLRFWESQYDVLYCPNFMNSPHGWSAWRLYGLFDLYRLTGKVDYLMQAMNGIGTCANLIDPTTGVLHWAFMTDAKITTDVFEEDPNNPDKGKRTVQTLGESYRPMISQWWRAPYGVPVFGYGPQGGCCDNDVHEIFKCLAEHALLTTWVVIDEQGNAQAWNGSVERKGDTYVVTPSEEYVNEVHVNTAKPVTVKTSLAVLPRIPLKATAAAVAAATAKDSSKSKDAQGTSKAESCKIQTPKIERVEKTEKLTKGLHSLR